MENSVHLLETTLRDGSYEIDFQFTPDDTALIAAALDHAGVKYIEICHGAGVGINRWSVSHFKIRQTTPDEGHLAAAQAVIQKASWGVLMVIGSSFAPVDHHWQAKHSIIAARLGVAGLEDRCGQELDLTREVTHHRRQRDAGVRGDAL